jgi:hypothetical protein
MQRINRRAHVALAAILTFAICLNVVPAIAGETEKASEIHQLISIDDLKKAVKDHEYLFVILSAVDTDATAIRAAAMAAAKKAEADEVAACVAELSRDCRGFKRFAKKSKVKKFPTVLVFAKDGAKTAVHGEITEKRLVAAYVELAEAEANTCPFASKHSNCDPTACGFKKK